MGYEMSLGNGDFVDWGANKDVYTVYLSMNV